MMGQFDTSAIPLSVWQSQMQQGTLGQALAAQSQMQQSSVANSLAQYQNALGGLADNCLGILSQSPAGPYATPERIGHARERCRGNLVEDGSKIIERIAFWNELPVVGAVVASRLADRLDKISDRIEELA